MHILRRLVLAVLAALAVLASTLVAAPAYAANVVGGWAQPLDGYSVTTVWREPSPQCVPGGPYPLANRYHLGLDLSAAQGAPVRSIGSGEIVANVVGSDWGTTNGVHNSALIVRYTPGDGAVFTVVYGHVQIARGLGVGTTVAPGQQIASIGAYTHGTHLHFGVHPGGNVPQGRLGTGTCPVGSSDNGFVDPQAYLSAHAPGPVNRAPNGSFDSAIATAPGVVRVRGWAFDPDAPSDALRLHL